jgi:hypothetical protein
VDRVSLDFFFVRLDFEIFFEVFPMRVLFARLIAPLLPPGLNGVGSDATARGAIDCALAKST